MNEQPSTIEVFLDLECSNLPKNDQTRKDFSETLNQRFAERLPQAVERMWDLPPLILRNPNGEYIELLLESRELYIQGNYYSCVAMCGIVGERLVKDVLRAALRIERDGIVHIPSDKALDQLERVETGGVVRFLREADLLSTEAAKAANDLGELRNQYAHARGKKPDLDALKAIKLLQSLVDGTVSMFKDFTINDGIFVPKAALPDAKS